VPLLFIGLGIATYFKLNYIKAKEKASRASVAIDKCMSAISGSWKSLSAAGAQAAMHHSMAILRRQR